MPSGGIAAAYGFNYQYLATAVYALQLLRDDLSLIGRTVLSIEPESVKADGEDDDIVDFAIEIDGEAVQRVQVKSSRTPVDRPLQPADARKVFDRLTFADPRSAILLTNRPLSRDLRGTCTSEDATEGGSVTGWRFNSTTGSGVSADSAARIIVDSRTMGVLEQELATLIREFRKDRALGQGMTSSRLLGAIVRHRIFDAAAGLQPRRISALDLVEMLSMPDPQIAHVAGAFDWGVPITGVPNLAASVPRLSVLDELTTYLSITGSGRAPRIGVLTGHTGAGKSVIASDYCHINVNSYEFICWIDCRDEGLIEARIRDIATQLTKSAVMPGTEAAPLFTGVLGRHRGPWLLVFDGVTRRQDIEKYIPTSGHGAALVTTTNSLGWWTSAHIIEVATFSTSEAIACFADYAGIPESSLPTVAGAVAEIVDRLGRIPLAVSMAGLYFRNVEGELHELVPSYFASLEALGDELAVPAGYDRTAFAAIRYAVDNIGQGTISTFRQEAKAALYYGTLLAPELIPLNLILPASALTVNLDLANLPRPAEADKTLTRAVVSVLRTQTIAHRVVSPDDFGRSTLASDTIMIHPLVHEIIRSAYLAELPRGQLQVAAATLIHYLIPWLGRMRSSGEFFALEQLRSHAEALLKIVEEREPLASFTPQHDRVYKYAKAGLLMELSACFASTARFDRSIRLASAAAQLLLSMPGEEAASSLAMKPMTDIVVDLALGEAAPVVLAAVGSQLVPHLTIGAGSTRGPTRALAYELADQSLQMVTRTNAYSSFPPLQAIAAELEELAARNPDRDRSIWGLVKRVNELRIQERFADILDLIPELRAADPSVYDQLTFDAIVVSAQLRVAQHDEAFLGIESLLTMQPIANHLILQLRTGLIEIDRTVREVAIHAEPTSTELEDYARRLQVRISELE